MTHPLANIVFEVAGLVAILALAGTVALAWPKILRAMKRRG